MNPLPALFWDVAASWEVSGLILMVLIARGLLGRRLPARMWFIAWLTLALALLVPFRIRVPVRMDRLGIKTDAAVLKSYEGGVAVTYARSPFSRVPPVAMSRAVAKPMLPLATTQAASRFTVASIPAWLWIWVGGMLVLGGIRLTVAWNFRRKLRDAAPVSSQLQTLAAREAERLGLRCSPSLVVSPAVGQPVLFGLVRPRLVFPPGLIEKLSDEELRFILLHEFGHCRRHDLAAQALLEVARIVHWFNPLVWLAVRVARADCELACDEFVLRRTQPEKRSDYGAALLAVLEMTSVHARLPVGLTMLNDKRALTQRIRRIADYRKGSSWSAMTGAIFLSLLVVAVVTQAAPTQPPAAEPAGLAGDQAAQKSPVRGVTFIVPELDTLTAPPGKPPIRPPFASLNLPLSAVTHLAFVVDTSMSMRDELTNKERAAVAGMFERLLLTVPHLQFFQVIDADGRPMLNDPQFRGPWIAATPETLAAAKAVLRDYETETTSDPTPGIVQAYRRMRGVSEPDPKFGVWVLGDEIATERSDEAIIEGLEQAGPASAPGRPRIALSAVKFVSRGPLNGGSFSQKRYLELMQKLARNSGGLFITVVRTALDREPVKQNVTTPTPAPVDEQTLQRRAYSQDFRDKRERDAAAQEKRDREIDAMDPKSAFAARIEVAKHLSETGYPSQAIRRYNRALELAPSNLSSSDRSKALREVLRAQQGPITVTFHSDGKTWISIPDLRLLAPLERFSMIMFSGTYDVIGRRTGYQDVHYTLEVRAGAPAPTLQVACTELAVQPSTGSGK